MRVISNTSPLIFLAKLDHLDLFHLYAEIIVPEAVLAEIRVKSGKETEKIESFIHHPSVQLRQAEAPTLRSLPEDLGAGEREAIAVALDVDADLVLLDDMQGREIAREHALSVAGTIGVLIEAHSSGRIASLRRELDRLIEAGLWISEAFYHRLLQDFEE